MKKLLACILMTIIVLSTCFSGGLAVSADSGKNVNSVAENATKTLDNKKDDNSYLAYISTNKDANKATKNLVQDLNTTILNGNGLSFTINVEEAGLYGIGMSYKPLNHAYSDITVAIKIDGKYPYAEAEKFEFPRMWCNEGESNRVDAGGNEFAPQQVGYNEFYFNEPICNVVETDERYLVYLTSGIHNVSIISCGDDIEISYFSFNSTASVSSYQNPTDESLYYNGDKIVIEGEDATIKSNYFLIGKGDTSSLDVTPQSAKNTKINYIGGENWKTVGDTLVWETPELEEGYYQIGFTYRQNFSIGSSVYRKLKIDGEVPFAEANAVSFDYDTAWQNMTFENKEDKPYLIYFSEGKHEISLTATLGAVADIRDKLVKASEELGSLYIDMTMITGEVVDVYRSYELFKQIGDMEERLINIQALLDDCAKQLTEITGEKSGSNYSIIMNMNQVITQMLNNKYDAHKYKSYYYTNYCSVSSVVQTLTEMPLSIDKIVLTSVGGESFDKKAGVFEKIWFSVNRFITTFVRDYNSISSSDGKGITVWVNWGRDQAQVLSSLVKNSFTPKTGINVNVKLVNAGIVQAQLLGDGPDCLLQQGRSTPVDLAMRGVLYDISKFEDHDEVLKRFHKGAEVPYRYKGGLYALPDTQNFFIMFYRKDILKEFNIEVPTTWQEFNAAAKILMRSNMNVALPNVAAVTSAQATAGAASIFPTLLMQRNVPLYAADGMSTNMLSADVMETMEMWTNFYRKQKFPITVDLYTRFRLGTTPIGVSTYTFYTSLKAAASEIDGLWGITTIPGTYLEDGSLSYKSAGDGTGCVIMKNSGDPQSAWEFLKWWTDSETQLSYSNEIEAILGPTGRVAVSNIEAFKNLDWESEDLEKLLDAWNNVEEIPEYPGSYYVSRSIYQCFWNVVNDNKNPKDMLMKFGKEADDEMERKWKQYANR